MTKPPPKLSSANSTDIRWTMPFDWRSCERRSGPGAAIGSMPLERRAAKGNASRGGEGVDQQPALRSGRVEQRGEAGRERAE